ncbi:MAG: hypothetical protein KC443_18820 [Anaerolineales bacterium]|nr:hypothetical protein [Anaerolineales bacterium]
MKLVALRCPQCDTWLQPGVNDVALLCAVCGTAVSLTDQGVQTIPITYGLPTTTEFSWHPFWLFAGQVAIHTRQTQGGNRADANAAQQFWGVPRRLYVPAWELPIHEARELGARLVREQPLYRAGDKPDPFVLQPATIDIADARKLLEFVVLTIEAQRSDWLRDLQFEIQATVPQLWALPAQRTNKGWQVLAQTGN